MSHLLICSTTTTMVEQRLVDARQRNPNATTAIPARRTIGGEDRKRAIQNLRDFKSNCTTSPELAAFFSGVLRFSSYIQLFNDLLIPHGFLHVRQMRGGGVQACRDIQDHWILPNTQYCIRVRANPTIKWSTPTVEYSMGILKECPLHWCDKSKRHVIDAWAIANPDTEVYKIGGRGGVIPAFFNKGEWKPHERPESLLPDAHFAMTCGDTDFDRIIMANTVHIRGKWICELKNACTKQHCPKIHKRFVPVPGLSLL